MSHIFDALLKSETEQPGSAARTSITDVLKQAEQRAAAQWKPKSGQKGSQGKPQSDPFPAAADVAHATPIARAEVPAALPDLVESAHGGTVASLAVLEEPLANTFETIQPQLPATARLVTYTDKGSAGAEAYRLLAVRLRHIRKDRQLKRVLITSTVPQEGKSLTSANLACALSVGGTQKVLLLEGDIRRPSLTDLFQLSDRRGICDWLQGRNSIEKSIYRIAGPEFCLLPCGRSPENPLDLIQSAKLTELLNEMNTLFDWIIIDSPPILPLADTSILSKLADGVLLVTRRGVTEKKHLESGLQALEKNKLLGTVVNSSRKLRHDYYYYGARSAGQTASDSAS